jgi:hypothetical protein
MSTATFHAGELAMQQQTGALDWMAQAGPRMIRDQMPPQHRLDPQHRRHVQPQQALRWSEGEPSPALAGLGHW